MYVRKASIRNVRSIREMDWEVEGGHEPGWHVLLGDNGAGKSTFLMALALVLIGPRDAEALRQDWLRWMTRDHNEASVDLHLIRETGDLFLGSGNVPKTTAVNAGIEIREKNSKGLINGTPKSRQSFLQRGIWGGARGWFSAAFGPFRRFPGGDSEFASISLSRPKLAAHLSLFGENFALTEAIHWLQELDYRRKDNKPEGKLLDELILFINNSRLLPHDTALREVSSDGVIFEDGNGCAIPIYELSDGYRSILSLTFELVRQLAQSYGYERVFNSDNAPQVRLPGVVLIDEVDAHLHPTWQHRIGTWFLDCFPRIQFIVTTHSPIICQAATRGSVWQLPQPGTEEPPRRILGTELDRILYGDVLDAYSTGVFGDDVTRSDEGVQRLEQLTELNLRSLHDPLSLTSADRVQQQWLRSTTPTSGYTLGTDGGDSIP